MATTMTVSDAFLSFLCETEGLRTTAYSDSGGVRTIGCGHTGSAVREGTISVERAYELARRDIATFEGCIIRNVSAPITQGMFDAMVSMAYNMGCAGFLRTDVYRLTNARAYSAAAEKIPQTNIRDRSGNVLRGLIRRRERERDMYLSDGIPGQSTARRVSVTTDSPLYLSLTPSQLLVWGSAAIVTAAAITTGIVWRRRRSRS